MNNQADVTELVSTFRNSTDPTVAFDCKYQAILEKVKTGGKVKDRILQVRSIYEREGKNGNYEKLKKQLPGITFQGRFGYRSKTNLLSATGFIIADLDSLKDVNSVFITLSQDKYTWFLFRSPSNDGLKCGFRAKGIKTDADIKRFYSAIEAYFKNTYNLTTDPACKDINRLCYFSYDPDIYINEDPLYFDINDWIIEEPDLETERPEPTKEDLKHSPAKEKYARKVLESCCNAIRESQPGTKHITRRDRSRLIGGYLNYISEAEVIKELEKAVKKNTDNLENSMKTIRDGLKYGKKNPLVIPDIELEEVKDSKSSSESIKVLNLEEIIKVEIPERDYLLWPVMPSQGLVMLYAPRGIGKTYVSLSCALAMAAGINIFHWKPSRPSRVLYIDGEMPAKLMQERITSLVAGMEANIDPNNFRLITPDLSGDLPNLAKEEGQKVINNLVNDFDVLILDNLSTLIHTGKESGSDEWLPVQGWLLELRRMGKSVLMDHHAGKGGSQRGTSSREDILDTVINLKRPKDYKANEGARIDIYLEKARGVYGQDLDPFEAKLESTSESGLVWTTRTLENAEMEMIRDLLENGVSVRDISKETGIYKSKVQRLKKKLGM